LNANERGNGLLVTVDYGAPTVLVERFLSAEITAIFADSALWVAIGIIVHVGSFCSCPVLIAHQLSAFGGGDPGGSGINPWGRLAVRFLLPQL
jgi:hypothetical protein